MIKKLFLPIVLVSSFSFAQIGINTPTPDASAALIFIAKAKECWYQDLLLHKEMQFPILPTHFLFMIRIRNV
jgi:hypothetical protein